MKKVLLVIFVLISFANFQAASQTDKLKSLEAERKKTLQEIESAKQLAGDLKKTTETLLTRIKVIGQQISSRKKLISLLNEEINSLTQEQKKAESDIKALEAELKVKKENYANAIKRMIYRKQDKNRLVFVLSGKSFSESARRIKYLREYSEWKTDQAEEIKQKQSEVEKRKEYLLKTRKEKLALLGQHKTEEVQLKNDEQAQQTEINEASKKQKELQAELKKKQERANALNVQIEKAIAEEIARQEREAKRIAEEKARLERERERERIEREKQNEKADRDKKQKDKGKDKRERSKKAEPAVRPEINIESEFSGLSQSFAANKGKFPLPVSGTARIVGHFGTHRHEIWKTVQQNNNGIDIQTSRNSKAISLFEGEVTRVWAIAGSNNGIIIRHGSYYTFYGNIQQVYVTVGQKISAGQNIGEVYNDAETGESVMHFQLWKGLTKLDPEPWFKNR